MTVPKGSVGYGRMRITKRAALIDLERLACVMARLSTEEDDDYSRFSERIRTAVDALAVAEGRSRRQRAIPHGTTAGHPVADGKCGRQ